MAAPLDIYGWKHWQDDLEDGLKAMGCQNASVGKLPPSIRHQYTHYRFLTMLYTIV